MRRTQQEMLADFKKIVKFAKKNKCYNYSELSRKLGVSRSEIISCIQKYKTEWEKISGKRNTENSKKQNEYAIDEYVIDASIAGCVEFHDVFDEILEEKGKVFLTSITIRELDAIQKFNDTGAHDARKILGTAAENPEKFVSIKIDETVGIPDDCIIQFCIDNKNLTLLTADKVMALKARMYNVETRYLKQGETVNLENQKRNKYITLKGETTYKNGQIFINQKSCPEKEIAVFSAKGEKYKENTCSLKIGDNVYVSSNKDEYITFAHYEVVSVNEKDNCRIVFSKRIYDAEQIEEMKNEKYRNFCKEFLKKIN